MSKKISVTFVDHLSNQIIGAVELSPDALPPSFEQNTTLFIDEADWNVVEADPTSSVDFIESGLLTLRLQKIEHIDPQNILFSLPTISNTLASDGNIEVDGSEFVLAEDDWRQFEFLSKNLKPLAEEEIDSILEVHQNASEESGWSRLHLREKIEAPLTQTIPFPLDFPHTKTIGLAFPSHAHKIDGGFAIELEEGAILYGVQKEGELRVLAIDASQSAERISEGIVELLKTFAQKHDLMIVDWCECLLVENDSPEFDEIL